jgi:hypothetical protein
MPMKTFSDVPNGHIIVGSTHVWYKENDSILVISTIQHTGRRYALHKDQRLGGDTKVLNFIPREFFYAT